MIYPSNLTLLKVDCGLPAPDRVDSLMQMVLGCDWEVCRLLSQKGTLSVPGFLLASTFITKGHKVFVIPMDSE
jgi:hypothetical protein